MPTLTATRVEDAMTEKVYTVRPSDDLATVWDLMVDHDVRHVPVVDDEESLVGLISHRDLLRAAAIEQSDVPPFVEQALRERTKAREVMVGSCEVVRPDTPLAEAAETMLANKLGCLPVVAGTRLVGILTEADFVRLVTAGA
jgi:CBS domain-containing membrane protein